MTQLSPADFNQMNADLIGGIATLFKGYFAAVKELEIEGNVDSQRWLPEFFLTFRSPETPQRVTVHVLFEEQTPKRKALEEKIRAAAKEVEGSGMDVVYHEPAEKQALHRTLDVSGKSYFVNSRAARQLSQMPVGSDAYGIYQTAVIIVLGLAWLIVAGALLLAFDWFALLLAVVVTVITLGLYWGLSSLPHLPVLNKVMLGKRREAFAQILSQCQVMGRSEADTDLLLDVPPHIIDLWRSIPAEQQSAALLTEDQWRLGEMRDLAQQAVEQLAHFPESSPDYPRRLAAAEKILGSVRQAFEAVGTAPTETATPLEELHQEVSRHARALGLGTAPTISPLNVAEGVKR